MSESFDPRKMSIMIERRRCAAVLRRMIDEFEPGKQLVQRAVLREALQRIENPKRPARRIK